jgi:hypothetical protein
MKSKEDSRNEMAAYATMFLVGVVSILALAATIQAIFGLV